MNNRLEGYIYAPDELHGKSAYEIAVMNGFDGTEAEWLESLTDEAVSRAEETIKSTKESAVSEINSSAEEVKQNTESALSVIAESVTGAERAEVNANISEDNAKNSADVAIQAKNGAEDAEVKAKISETNAGVSEDKAKTSENNAKDSENNAKTSETNAKASETNAKDSEISAKNSADSATSAKSAAESAASSARQSANSAEQSSVGASDAAYRANEGAASAVISATQAETSATEAKASEEKAKTAQTAAEAAAGVAQSVAEITANEVKKDCASSIRNTVSGKVITLSDVSPIEHILAVKARSENMIPYPYVVSTQTTNGVTFTDNGDGSITVNTPNGPATATTFYIFQTNITLPKGDYTLSGCPKGGSSTGYMMVLYDNARNQPDTGNGNSFVLEKETVFQRIYIRVESGTTVDNVTFYPQLTIGTEVKPWKPFVDVSTVSVKRYGKNLLPYPYVDTNHTENGITFTDNGDGTVTINETTTTGASFKFSNVMKIPQGNYVLSGGSKDAYVVLRTLKGQSLQADTLDANFTITDDEDIRDIYIYIGANKTFDNVVIKPMIAVDSTEYEPYKEPTTHSVNADGIVEDVKSLYPTTTLIPDKEGVVLDVEYNADTKKYVDNKFAELAAMLINS